MQQKKRGFTLVELMVVVAISAIALAIGVPAFQSVIQRNRADSVAMELTAAINLAREEAVRTRARAALCPRGVGDNGAPGNFCSKTESWSHGWLVVTLPGGGTDCTAITDSAIVRSYDPPDPTAERILISANSSAKSCLRFNATGFPTGATHGMTFTVQFPSAGKVTCLTMSSAGRLRRHDQTGQEC